MNINFSTIEGKSAGFRILIIVLGILAAGLLAGFVMVYLKGQQVWGVSNVVPWGQLITLDIYFIGLSAGAIVISSLGYVFHRDEYKPIGRIAIYMGLLMMLGAMVSVVLDLGRPEKFWRLFMYGYLNNMTSLFAINGIFYLVYILLMVAYLWLVIENKTRLASIIGMIDVFWALLVHMGTGAIFGLIGTREIMASPLKPIEFVTAALTSGTSLVILVTVLVFSLAKHYLNPKIIISLGKLLSFFIIGLLVLVFLDKLAHAYFPANEGVIFLLMGPYWWLFWIFQVGLGLLIPLIILFHPISGKKIRGIVFASISVIIGVFGERAAIVIPGTAQVQQVYPGHIQGIWGTSGNFPIVFSETILTVGIVSLIALLFVVGLKYLELLPVRPNEGPMKVIQNQSDTGENK